MNKNKNPLSERSVISYRQEAHQFSYTTEPFRNGDRKTNFNAVDFNEHSVEAALIALDELVEARTYLNTNNPDGVNITVGQLYVTATRLVKGKHARKWAQRLQAVPQGARTIQRLRDVMAQMIDDVTGQTNCRDGLVEYLEKRIKFYNQCSPSEYISRYEELVGYASNLNGTEPAPTDATAMTWCIKTLTPELQIYLDEQGGTDGINHYTRDPDFTFVDLGKLCNKKQKYTSLGRKKEYSTKKRGHEKSGENKEQEKPTKKVRFAIDRQGVNKNKSKYNGGGGGKQHNNACTLPHCVEAARRAGFNKPNHTNEQCHFQNGQTFARGRGGGYQGRGGGYQGRGGNRSFQGRGGGGYQGRGGGHQGPHQYANEGRGNDSYIADIVAQTVTAMNQGQGSGYGRPFTHPPQYDSHHLDSRPDGRSPYMPPPGYTHPGRGGY